tara:strand:+ start:725 stop:1150 length:426 start_codon:yes stop_codon:yes gene_type:complete
VTEYDDDIDLPLNPTLDAIMLLIGEELATVLADKFSGQRIYFPQKTGDCRIARAIGYDALEIVIDVYGGLMMEVPVSIGRKAAVIRLLNRGNSVAEVISTLHCTRNYVYNVQKEYQNDGLKGLFNPPVNISKNQLSFIDEL